MIVEKRNAFLQFIKVGKVYPTLFAAGFRRAVNFFPLIRNGRSFDTFPPYRSYNSYVGPFICAIKFPWFSK